MVNDKLSFTFPIDQPMNDLMLVSTTIIQITLEAGLVSPRLKRKAKEGWKKKKTTPRIQVVNKKLNIFMPFLKGLAE